MGLEELVTLPLSAPVSPQLGGLAVLQWAHLTLAASRATLALPACEDLVRLQLLDQA